MDTHQRLKPINIKVVVAGKSSVFSMTSELTILATNLYSAALTGPGIF